MNNDVVLGSHRFNNLTLSTTAMTDDDEDNNNDNKSKYSSTRLPTKSVGRTRNHENGGDDEILSTTRSKRNKNQSKQGAKSMMATKNRRK